MTAELKTVGLPRIGSGAAVARGDGNRLSGQPDIRRRHESDWPAYRDMVGRVAVLERTPVFFALDQGTQRLLATRLRRVTVAAGDLVLCQGEPGDTIFFVEKGRCRLVVERSSSSVTVAKLAPGDFFGERACVLNRPQPASVYADSDCSLLALDRASLHAVLGREQAVLEQLGKVADERSSVFAEMTEQASWGMFLHEATVVGVYSPKGGTGGSCLSLNLVGSLARRFPGQVLHLDLDFPYCHAALLAGLVPTSSLARAGAAPIDAFEEALLSAVLYHRGGPMILVGALRPEEADEVTPDLVTRAIGVLRKTFKYIVVDLGVAINDSTLALLDLTQHVVLVAAPELTAVKSAADAVGIMLELGTPDDRLTVVLNNRSPKSSVTRLAVEQILARPVDVEVGYDGMRPELAAVNGDILSLTNPKSEITRAAEALAELLEAIHGRNEIAGESAGKPTAELSVKDGVS
jgi:MinD-like ATPase involved in chromosome partitioning or flagellar assembly